ncbi:hypothetical protein N7516_002467 [Penicillium verrucosum]|uniref:uncharacterized protein n=1 Tax=Penicillium verrucosum TaxID=60171 RepID=UPI002545750C|nr:uncharacterized protein N7516_002467 [Penicillium verrucosum]KAJ5942299.1 hypothetical protein N7516_002467 [Penicillium verrucosum]
MPKKKELAQSDTSRSTQSSQSTQSTDSTDSQFANQSPASSRSHQSSSGLTEIIDTIAQKFSSASSHSSTSKSSGDIIMTDFDGQAESPDLLISPESQPEVLKKKHPAQKPDSPKKKRTLGLGKTAKRKGVNKPELIAMKKVITMTQRATDEILFRTELEGTRFGYLANRWTAPVLDPNSVEYPNLNTVIRVVAGDTYDRALEMQKAGSTIDHMPVCVLNFANASRPGGGWLNGARAQEEQLCYRSTLIDTLHTRFYPMDDLECLYSPNVIVFRKSMENEYAFMSKDEELHLNPTVSVISMAARNQPKLTADKSTYAAIEQRYLMMAKMQLILRTAANNNHRRLILGSIGCGAFRHPTQEVAECWYDVLMKKEFKGWFERIYFAVRDAPKENNFEIFRETLDGLNI